MDGAFRSGGEAAARADSLGAEIRWPAYAPARVLELLTFMRAVAARMRVLRDGTALPREAVTLPGRFEPLVSRIFSAAQRAAEAAAAAGEPLVRIAMPHDEDLAALAAWARPRLDLLTGLARAGLIAADWEGPVATLEEVYATIAAQVPPRCAEAVPPARRPALPTDDSTRECDGAAGREWSPALRLAPFVIRLP